MTINNLLITAGGIKGIIMLGILEILYEYNILKNINNYYGISVGSIICLLLILNYTPNELTNFIINFPTETLLDNNNKLNILDNLFNNFGIYNINNLKYIIEQLLVFKNIRKNITFIELFKKTNKELTINISNINKIEYKEYNYKLTPNVKIIDILLISCSIPIIFKPSKINNDYYADGGIFGDFPIEYFKNKLDNTLIITTNININNNIQNFNDYFLNLIFGLIKSNTCKDFSKCKYIIIIENSMGINFNISKKEKIEMTNTGRKLALEFIKQNFYYKFFMKNKDIINIYE
tara:strand:+ start:679 stop:1554 length:876 start_codon:yes stop_codon:yes gene_type:complete